MFAQVKLLKGFKEPLLYEAPDQLKNDLSINSLVKVPLRNQTVYAYVQKLYHEKPAISFNVKKILSIEQLPHDMHYFKFIDQLAYYYQTEPVHFLKRLYFFLNHEKPTEFIDPFAQSSIKHNVTLTSEQQQVVSFIQPYIQDTMYLPTLLHGVTGSGKTEVYKALIEHAIAHHKTIILLLPEVSLAAQFTQLLKEQLPAIPIVSFHSATAPTQKKMVWNRLLNAEPTVIIGVHLPLLLPIANLGLIIIDEEHEAGYQEKKHPKINTKEAALFKAHCAQIPILLGSATPSISSLYMVNNKKWHFFQLKKRFNGVFPKIKIVSLLEKKERRQFWISTELINAIRQRLAAQEQIMIFLNRRGFSFFVQCKQCSFIFYCNSCSVSLTLHHDNHLLCHYCGFSTTIPPYCGSCKHTDFLKKGIGTQFIVQTLQHIFPTARIARADLDATINKKKWQNTINLFKDGALDMLVGTQTITKGYHFPKVSLVGIIWADLNLHFPIYNAVETTLQQLIQVAGRAGRTGLASEVILQTMGTHPVFAQVNELQYADFYQHEIENRMLVNYPPFTRLVEIEFKHANDMVVEQDANFVADFLSCHIKTTYSSITVLGPTKPPVWKLKNWYMRKIYLKSNSIHDIIRLYRSIPLSTIKSFIYFTPNPLN